MIRILHIVSSLGTGSGVMSVLMSYHRNLDRQRIQFDYLSFRQTEQTFEEEILALGGRVYHFPKPAMTPEYRQLMNDFFREHRGEYPIIHCHPIYSGVFFGAAARKNGVRHVIQHSHSTNLSDKLPSAARNGLMLTLFHGHITRYAACSEAAKRVFWWKKPGDVYVMRNALDVDKFAFSPTSRSALRDQLEIGENTLVLGHIGRFAPEKNHMFLLEVLKEVRTRQEAKLLLVGDGPRLEDVKAAAAARGLSDCVIFAGRQENVAGYLSAMDVFLLPSTFEGLGIVLLEAQCNGLPCIASDRVPQEATISDQVKYLPLEAGAGLWGQETAALRRSAQNGLRAEPYRIETAARGLEAYYEELN